MLHSTRQGRVTTIPSQIGIATLVAGLVGLAGCGTDDDLPTKLDETGTRNSPNPFDAPTLDAGRREFDERDAGAKDAGAKDAGPLVCDEGTENCDNDDSNGCEDLQKLPHCGECGEKCNTPEGQCQVEAGRCEGEQCAYDFVAGGTRCRKKQCAGDSPEMCSGSSADCPAPCGCDGQACCDGGSCGDGFACRKGKCGPLVCQAGTKNCDGDASNGCESLNRIPNCGKCGRECGRRPKACQQRGSCENESCVYEPKTAGAVCRKSQCVGDPAERCDGESPKCDPPCGCAGQRCCEGGKRCGSDLACRASGECDTPCPVPTLSGRAELCESDRGNRTCDDLRSVSANGSSLVFGRHSIALGGFELEGSYRGSCRRRHEDLFECPRLTGAVANGNEIHFHGRGGGSFSGSNVFKLKGATATGRFTVCAANDENETVCGGIADIQAIGNQLVFTSKNGDRGAITFTSTCK